MKRYSLLALLVVFGLLVTACAPATPQVIEKIVKETVVVQQTVEKQVTVEKEVVRTVVVEKQVEKVVVVTPTPIPPAVSKGTTLVFGATGGPAAQAPICPWFCSGGWCANTWLMTNPGLTTQNDKLEVVPVLATKWEANDKSDTFTFYLDPKARWSDGTPLTADDVAFTYQGFVDPKAGANWPGPGMGVEFKGQKAFTEGKAATVEGIQVVDKGTIKFVLEKPNADFPRITNQGIMPKHILKDTQPAEYKTHPYCANGMTVSSGPFQFVKREGSATFELAAVKDYWGKAAKFDKVIVKALMDDVAATQLQAGDVEVGRVPGTEFKRLSQLPHLTGVLSPEHMVYYFYFNTKQPYLKDKRVREAIYYAMDRKAMLDVVFDGLGRVVDTPALAPDWAAAPDLVNKYTFDPDKAKKLLTEAGWDFNRVLRINVGPWPDNTKPAEVLQAQLTNIGMRVEVRIVAVAAWVEEFNKNEWDMSLDGFSLSGGPTGWASTFRCGGWFSTASGYCNQQSDDLGAQAAALTDQAKRGEIYKKLAKQLFDDLPAVCLYATGTPYVVNKGLKGIRLPSMWTFMAWNITDWSR